MLKKYYSVFGPLLRLLDAFILTVCWILSYYLRKNFPLKIMTNTLPSFEEYWPYAILIILLWGTVFSLNNLYSSQRLTRRTIEAYKVLKAHVLSLMFFVTLTYLVSTYKLSRGVFLYFGFLAGFLLVFVRVSLRNLIRYLRKKGFNRQKVLIIGSGKVVLDVVEKLKRHPELGLDFIGLVTINNQDEQKDFNLKILGTLDSLNAIIKSNEINKIIIALPRSESAYIEEVLSRVKDEVCDVIIIPDIYDYIALGYEVEDFDGLPLVSINETPIVGFNFFLKRVFDVLVSLILILIFSPIMILIAILIKLTSKGPVFYLQERMSLNGRPFKMIKFRSMRIDQKGDVEILTKANDPRVTLVGKWIRKTSLDELPQLFNVLIGDMSLVGPRPERSWVVEELKHKIPRYMLKHKVKAGITGWAQVNGFRGDTSLEKRIEYDLYYIKNWSLLLDIKILWLTLFRGFINKNAY
jgi:Undecaprenyl-phosphate glucose phosphotransferase